MDGVYRVCSPIWGEISQFHSLRRDPIMITDNLTGAQVWQHPRILESCQQDSVLCPKSDPQSLAGLAHKFRGLNRAGGRMPETRYSICCHLLPPPPLPITPAAEELNRVQITKLPGAIQLSVVKTEVGGSNSARYRRRWPRRIHLPHSW